MFPQKQLLYVGNKLSRHGLTPTGIEFLGPELESLGFSVIYKSDYKNKILRLLDMVFGLILNSRKTDLVIVDTYPSSAFYYAYIVGRLSFFLKKQYICILHGGDLPHRINISKSLCDWLFSHSRTNVVISEYIGRVMKNNNYSYTVIPNFIKIEKYQNSNKNVNRNKIIWVRSFHKIYNPELAIRIIHSLKKDFPNIELIMIGPDKDGSRYDCEKLSENLDLGDNITFTGKLSKDQWTDLAKDSCLFLNTTTVDNFPVSLLEAMALSIPIVTSKVGGIPWIVEDQVDGFLVETGNVDMMVQAITKLLLNLELRDKMAKEARRKAEKYDWESIAPKWIELLSST